MEQRAMRQQLISRARTAAAALVVVGLPVSGFAQTGQSTPANLSVQIPVANAPETVRRLSVDDAVQLGLEQNLGIQIQRIEPQIQDVGVSQARSFWAPMLTSNVSRNSVNQPATSAIVPSYENSTTSTGLGINQTLPWGGSYNANWSSSRQTSTNIFNNFSPQLFSTLQLNYTQPLLRNFKIDQIREQVRLSQKLRDLSDIQLNAVIVQTTRSVKNAYWDLAYAINNLKAQQQSLELAQQSLTDNQKRVQIGTMAPIDIVQAQAEVASNQQNVIVAQAQIKQAEDRLRALIFDPSSPDFWTMQLEPTDTAPFAEVAVDLDAAVRNALDKRADLREAKNSLEQSDVYIRYFRNQVLPDVNAVVNYGAVGYGGVQLEPIDPFSIGTGGVTRTVLSQRSFGSVLGDVLQAAYPQWAVGVQIGYPLGSNTAEANLARARLQYQQSQVQLKNLELQVVTQVRDAARQVVTNEERVKSARASRELQEKKLEAEEKKFAAGMSTSFFVFQAQRDLAQARTLEIQAISDYNKSLVDFQAVQEIPLTGGGTGLTTAGAGAVQTGSNAIIRGGGN
ncbi:MAG: TolC family protein [Betaproteobacteria bacterium]